MHNGMIMTTLFAACAEFLSSLQNMPPRPQSAQFMHGPGSYSRNRPGGNGRSEFILFTQKRQFQQQRNDQFQNDNSLPAARDNFLGDDYWGMFSVRWI